MNLMALLAGLANNEMVRAEMGYVLMAAVYYVVIAYPAIKLVGWRRARRARHMADALDSRHAHATGISVR